MFEIFMFAGEQFSNELPRGGMRMLSGAGGRPSVHVFHI